MVLDRATPHTPAMVTECVGSRGDEIKLLFLPTSTLEINAIEEHCHQAKTHLAVAEYYAGFEDMQHKVSECLRTHHADPDMEKFMYRVPLGLNNI